MTSLQPGPQSIVVVRHGETDWNADRRIQGRTDVPLNAVGRAQALEAAQHLRVAGTWSRVIASPLSRAFNTGSLIADVLGLSAPEVDATLIERNFAAAEGRTVAEANATWPGLVVPGAETMQELTDRGANAFRRILHESPGSVVVAHGALIRAALTDIAGRDIPRVLNCELWEISLTPHRDATPTTQSSLSVERLAPAATQPEAYSELPATAV